jgi:hypothetical protein
MQIPASAGMLANSVLPATPTQSGLLPQVGESAGSASFAPIEAVSNIRLSREIPEQRAQPDTAPENSGQARLAPQQNAPIVNDDSAARSEGAENNVSDDDDQNTINQSNREPRDDAQHEADQAQQHQEQQQQQDLDIILQLSQRDSMVRAHEQAHSSVGGQYAGSAQYSYQRGPDGVNYAVGGEVSIDVGAISGDPQATLAKMQIVQRAALAPAEPSSQDRRVAALASQQASQARAEIVSESRATNSGAESNTKIDAKKSDDKEEAIPELAKDASNIRVSAPVGADSENFQVFNDRIAKINEILLAISQNDVSNATGQLLDAVV